MGGEELLVIIVRQASAEQGKVLAADDDCAYTFHTSLYALHGCYTTCIDHRLFNGMEAADRDAVHVQIFVRRGDFEVADKETCKVVSRQLE